MMASANSSVEWRFCQMQIVSSMSGAWGIAWMSPDAVRSGEGSSSCAQSST